MPVLNLSALRQLAACFAAEGRTSDAGALLCAVGERAPGEEVAAVVARVDAAGWDAPSKLEEPLRDALRAIAARQPGPRPVFDEHIERGGSAETFGFAEGLWVAAEMARAALSGSGK